MRKEDKGWLAGIIDGEGCIFAYWHRHPGGNKVLALHLTVTNTDKRIVDACRQLTGVGTIRSEVRGGAHRRCYKWTAVAQQGAAVLEAILPFLRGKEEQAKVYILLAQEMRSRRTPRKLGVPTGAWQETLYNHLKELKRA